jgi:MFS family permease
MSKLYAQRLPAEKLGYANGLSNSGLAFGPAFGTLAGGIILAGIGWRAMFLLFGALAFLWLIPLMMFAADVDAPPAQAETAAPPSYAAILRRRALWGACLGHFSVNYSLYFVLSWLPLWLVRERGFSILEMAKLGAAVYFVYGVSSIVTGWTTDRLIARGMDLSAVRKGATILSHLGFALGLAGCALGSPFVVIGSLFFCGVAFGLHGNWPIVQTLAGPRAAARWVAFQNAVANTAGIIVPVVTGLVVDRTGSFAGAFLLAAAVALVGAGGWAFIVGRIAPVDWGAA